MRSPRIAVTENRKGMNKVGSLSPRLRALIEEKTEGSNIVKLPKLGSKKLSSRSVQRSEFDRSQTTKPK